MWINPDGGALALSPVLHACLDGARGEPRTSSADEKRELFRFRDCLAHCEPRLQGHQGVPTNGDDPGFVTFTRDSNGAVRKVEVTKIYPDELSESQPRRIEELQHRTISYGQIVFTREREQTRDLVGIKSRRQPSGRLRRLHTGGRIGLNNFSPDHEGEEATYRG